MHEDLLRSPYFPPGSRLYQQEMAFIEFVEANRDLGYGRMMQLISAVWKKHDPVGALSLGPPYGTLTAVRARRESDPSSPD